MRNQSGRLVALCAGLLVSLAGIVHAQCVPLSTGDLFLDPATTIPANEHPALFVELADFGSVTFPPREGAAVIGIHALPPKLIQPENEAQPGVHYSACIDASTGFGSLSVGFQGPLFVRVDYAGGGHDFFVVSGRSDLHGDAPACRSGYNEFTTSNNALVLESPGIKNSPDHATQRSGQTIQEVSTVQDVASAVQQAPPGTELVLDTHGSKNGIQLSKGNNVTVENIDALVNALGGNRARLKLTRIKLLGCNLASDKGNKKFVQELAKRTGVEVQASSEAVRPYSVPGNEAATFTHCTTGQIMSFGP